jgi:undecaprenyl-diphosphatase
LQAGGFLSTYIESIILGIVEGLTEFLPVSSTAHLRITEALMRIPMDDAYWKMYTIVIQFGAILALMLLFLGRIVGFLRTFPKGEDGRHNRLNHPIIITLVAFVCTSVPALLLHKWSERNLGSLTAMALALLIGGVVMWLVDWRAGRYDADTNEVEKMNLLQGIWIGLCQTLSAVFPGVSRSMSTIAAGEIAGLSRPAALEFSFLLSIPTMVAATGWELVKEVHGGEAANVGMNSERWIVLLIGLVVSFIVAFGVVEWFLYWVRKHGFTIFAIYRIVLGGALLLWGSRFIG